MTENNTSESNHQAEDTALSTPDSPLDVLSSIIKPQTGKEYILPVLICIITLFHFFVFPQWDSFWINIIRLSLSILTISYITNIARKSYNKRLDIIKSFNNNQPQFFTTIVAFGGMLAIFIPMIMNIAKLIDNSALLTTALLTITGGIIAIFGYYITHQKSELEKEQMNMQKQKDARDHIRQLHDSYNDRFDKAVAELYSNDVKAAYTAVPKLAKLADAWLDYEDLSNDVEELKKLEKKSKKEVQIIINVFCKYIRTLPNNYTDEQFSKFDSLSDSDKKTIADEADIRRLIFAEISDRLSRSTQPIGSTSVTPGIWSKFNFDFSQAPIFYPLDNLHLENSDFTGSTIYKGGKFTQTKFIGKTIFNGAHFKESINFTHAHFIDDAIFQGAHFEGDVDFSQARFEKTANFALVEFNKPAIFHWVYFIAPTYFNQAHFKDVAKFTFTRFIKSADFNHMQFNKYANFEGAHFAEAYFVQANFIEVANFRRARFYKKLELCGSNFVKHVFFNSAYFNGDINFNATFQQLPPTFVLGEEVAHFSCKYKFYDFSEFMDSPHTIDLGEAELDGIKCRIPVGTVLFDPESLMDHNSEYLELSEPAKRIEESDNQGETPSG